MQATDFGHCLSAYLKLYLPGQKGLSVNTIASYRDTFKLILIYSNEKENLWYPPNNIPPYPKKSK